MVCGGLLVFTNVKKYKNTEGEELYICYSTKNGRYDYEEISYHMHEWGISVKDSSEDGCNCVREDNVYYNNIALKNEEYAIILLSEELMTDISVLSELENIKRLFLKKRIKVFCFNKGVDKQMLPPRLEWLRNTVFMDTDSVINTHKAVYKVLLEYTSDRAGAFCAESSGSIWQMIEKNGFNDDMYIKNIKKAYGQVKAYDYERKITLLYALYTYIMTVGGSRTVVDGNMYSQCIENIYSYMGMCMPFDKTQLDIIKYCMLLMFETESNNKAADR